MLIGIFGSFRDSAHSTPIGIFCRLKWLLVFSMKELNTLLSQKVCTLTTEIAETWKKNYQNGTNSSCKNETSIQ